MGPSILLVVGTCAGLFAYMKHDMTKRRAMIEQLARDIGGVANEDEARATLLGVPVRFAFVQRGTGRSRQWWTEAECTPPPAYPLDLHVRRRGWFDERMIARGTMVDVQVGEPRFDETFLVEAAPADVVRQLFDQDFRTFLLSVSGALTSVHEGPSRVVRLSVRGRIEDLGEARRYLEMLAQLAARVPAAFMQADAALPTQSIGSPFREIVDTSAQRDAGGQRLIEVDRVAALRKARAKQTRIVTIIVALVLFGGYLVWAGHSD